SAVLEPSSGTRIFEYITLLLPNQAVGYSGRVIRIGSPEWRTTVSAMLPNIQRLTPERPWEHIETRLSGVFCPSEIISSAAKPSLVTLDTFATPSFLSSVAFLSRYSVALSRTAL